MLSKRKRTHFVPLQSEELAGGREVEAFGGGDCHVDPANARPIDLELQRNSPLASADLFESNTPCADLFVQHGACSREDKFDCLPNAGGR
jgi:hypothetical protein